MALGTCRVELTDDEVIALLKRSRLPTVLTEGRDDYLIFRELEESLIDISASLMPVGGRDCLFSVFKRRSEIGRMNEIAFIADRDLWVMQEIPEQFVSSDLIFTDGYSIENDLYRDGNLERLLSATEKSVFLNELAAFTRWYAFAVHHNLNGVSAMLGCRPERVLENGGLRPAFLLEIGYNDPPDDIYLRILTEYRRLLRGKSLLNLLMRQLSYSGRPVKHSYGSLLETSASSGGAHMASIKGKV